MNPATSPDQATQQISSAMPPASTPPASGSGSPSWGQVASDAMSSSAQASPGTPPGQPGQAAPAPAATPVQAPPQNAEPVRPKGLRGFMDRMIDSMAGTDTSRVRKDPEGNLYIQHETPTRGQQWLRIAVDAFRGAAAGMAAGKGAGNQYKAVQAGIQSQDQQQSEREKTYQEQQLAVANSQALKHQLAAQAFEMTRKQVQAAQSDIDFSEKRADWLESKGGVSVGHVSDLSQLAKLMRETPGFHEDQVKHDLMVPVMQYDDQGRANGFEIYRMPQGYGQEMTAPGTAFQVYDPIKDAYVEHKTTEWTPQSKIDQFNMAAGTAKQEHDLKAADIKNKGADTSLKGAQATEATATAKTKPSETAKNLAEAGLDRAKADQVKTGQLLADGGTNPQFELMAQAVHDGDLLPKDLKRQAKGMGLDPNQVLARAFEIGKEEGRPLSLPILEQQDKFASSPKTQAAVDGIDRVIGAPGVSGYVDQMLSLAKQANLAGGPGAGLQNDVSLWVRRNLGDTAAKNLDTSIAETRRSIAGLIGNPLLGGSETDKRLQQAEEMLGKRPTMENLQGAADILTSALESQRQSIVGNNIYLQKRYGTKYKQPARTGAAAPPQGATMQVKGSDGKMHWSDGKADLGVVQQ